MIVNAGDGFNLGSGSFTPPVPGIYIFTFTGLGENMRSCSKNKNQVELQNNGVTVMSATSLSLSTTLVLDSSDTITMSLIAGNLLDYGSGALFTGTLLEEIPLFK